MPLVGMDVAAFGEEVAFIDVVLFELVGDTYLFGGSVSALGVRGFLLAFSMNVGGWGRREGGPTARGDGAPADDFLDHGAQDGQLRGVGGFGHAVAANAVDFLLQLGLPFRVQAHGEDVRHHGGSSGEQAGEAEHPDDVGAFRVVHALLLLAGFQERAHEGGGRRGSAGADFLFDGVHGAEEEVAFVVVAGALGALPGGEPFGQPGELGHDVGEVGGG